MSAAPLRIATRASQLALWQARHVADLICGAFPEQVVELVELTTAGDRNRTLPLHHLGGTGVFTREVQAALLDGRADVAVHSLKDLPTESAAGLVLAAAPQRASVFDLLVFPSEGACACDVSALPRGARIGTGSLRRQAQLLHLRPDLVLKNIRGNLDTRLRKLDQGEFDAIVLAEAGLQRLGLLGDRPTAPLRPPVMFPAVGQGALGIECRSDDETVRRTLAAIDDLPTHRAVAAERTLLAELRAGCHAPVGVFTETSGDVLTLKSVVLSPDGARCVYAESSGPVDDPAAVGRAVAAELRAQGADELINRPGS